MRDLLTITRYELLMQLKSIRLKGLCVAILVVDVALYMGGMKSQDLRWLFTGVFFSKALLFYLPAAVFAGLFSVGRIRKTGMHSLLMARPFSTFALILGQLLAAVLSCIIPLALFLFPSGLVLRWQYGLDFPVPPLLHAILFYFTPSLFCVLAITIWVRTCFKNNLVSIIILAAIFAALVLLAKSPICQSISPQGGAIHNFIPLVSVFSGAYWQVLSEQMKSPGISFFHFEQWARFLLSIICSGIFLILACYHLRRTEPHRKVIGTYGRRWYHMPTFLQIFCDLKIDPHMNWRTHLLLLAFIAIVGAKVIMPLNLPFLGTLQSTLAVMFVKEGNASPAEEGGAFGGFSAPDVNKLEDGRLLVPVILRDIQRLSPEGYDSRMEFRLSGEARKKIVAFQTNNRFLYRPQSVFLDGNPVPFSGGNQLLLDGNAFSRCSDGKTHTLYIRAKYFGPSLREVPGPLSLNLEGYRVCQFIQRYFDDSSGEMRTQLRAPLGRTVELDVTLQLPREFRLLHAPMGAKEERDRKSVTFRFHVPAETLTARSEIVLSMGDTYTTRPLPGSNLGMRFCVHKSEIAIAEDILQLAKPVIEEYYSLRKFLPEENVLLFLGAARQSEQDMRFKNLRRSLQRYRHRGFRGTWEKDNLMQELRNLEGSILHDIFTRQMNRMGVPDPSFSPWDLYGFLLNGHANGLSKSITGTRNFQAPMLWPVQQLSTKDFQKIFTLPRPALFDENLLVPRIPLFQMLYFQMGHDEWFKMVDLLKPRLLKEDLTVDLLESLANQVSPEPMNWFFDYWCRTGQGFPSYRVNKAVGRLLKDAPEGAPQYEVEAEIQNLGTGRMQVPLLLWTAKENVSDKIWIGPGETVQWKTVSRYLPKSVEANAFRWVCAAPYPDETTGKPVEISKCEVIMEKQP